MRGIKFIPDDINFNFMKVHILAFLFSAVLILGSLGLVFTKGLSFGIDFKGGTAIEIATPVAPDLSRLREALNNLGLGEISIQEFGEADTLLIRMAKQEGDNEAQIAAIDKVRAALDAEFADKGEIDYRRTEFVGPQVGEELKKQGLLAFVLAMGGILAYVWFRFEWQYGVAAIIALAHDCISVLGFFVVTDMEFNLTIVAAVLTIAGYSINDTVVVFDRIRETLRKYKKKPFPEILNMSINQTLSRTVVTGLTTLLSLIVLYIFGGEVIRGFVDALIWGIIVGTYSSVFVAAPILLYLNVRRGGKVAGGDEQEA